MPTSSLCDLNELWNIDHAMTEAVIPRPVAAQARMSVRVRFSVYSSKASYLPLYSYCSYQTDKHTKYGNPQKTIMLMSREWRLFMQTALESILISSRFVGLMSWRTAASTHEHTSICALYHEQMAGANSVAYLLTYALFFNKTDS